MPNQLEVTRNGLSVAVICAIAGCSALLRETGPSESATKSGDASVEFSTQPISTASPAPTPKVIQPPGHFSELIWPHENRVRRYSLISGAGSMSIVDRVAYVASDSFEVIADQTYELASKSAIVESVSLSSGVIRSTFAIHSVQADSSNLPFFNHIVDLFFFGVPGCLSPCGSDPSYTLEISNLELVSGATASYKIIGIGIGVVSFSGVSTISVPAGEWETFRFDFRNKGLGQMDWAGFYAPGPGLIRMVGYAGIELQDYRKGPGQ